MGRGSIISPGSGLGWVVSVIWWVGLGWVDENRPMDNSAWPIRRKRIVLMTVVSPSVCLVLGLKSRTERRRKLKFGRKEFQDTDDL